MRPVYERHCGGAIRQARMRAMADLEEVMRFDPDDGIANLDEHLDRLKAAAEAQGFKFDRHAARNELQAATFGKRRPAIARLLLSPTGMMAIEVKAAD
jgi:branched-subunit amino acid aminotransferase/4-amino-4-deoxychorismate lyase